MAESWENLGIPGEGNRAGVTQGSQGSSCLPASADAYLFVCLISGCGHIADELEVSCIYTTNFPEVAHYELVVRRCF